MTVTKQAYEQVLTDYEVIEVDTPADRTCDIDEEASDAADEFTPLNESSDDCIVPSDGNSDSSAAAFGGNDSQEFSTTSSEIAESGDSETYDRDKESVVEDEERARRLGAGVASGIFGLLIGGPILACILGFVVSYATKLEGCAGDTARAIGDLAVSARNEARKIDSKHRFVHRSKVVAANTWDRIKSGTAKGWEAAADLDREHRARERAAE